MYLSIKYILVVNIELQYFQVHLITVDCTVVQKPKLWIYD